MKSNITDRHQQALDHALMALAREEFKVCIDAVYLFGSCARGEFSYKSDIDLLIQYNQHFTPELGRAMRSAVDPDDYRLPEVELKFVSSDEWKTGEDQFSKNLQKDGIKLWERK